MGDEIKSTTPPVPQLQAPSPPLQAALSPPLQALSPPLQALSPGGTNMEWKPTCAEELKPQLNMEFGSIEEGIAFYNSYARACGFVMRLHTEKKASDGVVLSRYIVCNKHGYTYTKAKLPTSNKENKSQVDGNKEGKVDEKKSKNIGKPKNILGVRKRVITRMGCKACIRLTFCGGGRYRITNWHEGHKHRFTTPSCMHLLTSNRNVNIMHKKFIVDCSKNNIGPVKSYRIFKEIVGGYSNVGATMQDFKNFQRDLKAYIGGSDAQMVIDNFFSKQEIWAAFYFEYDVDESGTLTRLFWADPVARNNYALFGDSFSFDTTFETNRYNMVFAPFTGVDHHRKCVTFAVGFVAKEDVDSFVWLFECFLRAMGQKQPSFIITDQDPAMKIAIPRVFDKANHWFCMWHITEKMKKKVGPTLSNDTDFLSKISACIWNNYLEPEDFERGWMSVITEFNLQEHDWLNNIFGIRESWIPAYFRDIYMGGLMRTTSRSESENSFFSRFINPSVSLVEFMMRYESAMDAQRHAQSELNHQSYNNIPVLKTPLPLELIVSEVHTLTIFYEVQEEIAAACFVCEDESLERDGTMRTHVIRDNTTKTSTVLHNTSNNEASCTCKKFERHGILCRHIFFVYKGMSDIPSKYLLNHWTKDAPKKGVHQVDGIVMENCVRMQQRKALLNELWSHIHIGVATAEQNDDVLGFLEHIKSYIKKSMVDTSNNQRKSQVIECLLGVKAPKDVKVQVPNQCKNKGSGRRLRSDKEKAVEEHKKKQRTCRACGMEGVNHDSRNCPSVLES